LEVDNEQLTTGPTPLSSKEITTLKDYPIKEYLPELILASQSVARKSLLESYGCIVHVHPTHSDEYHGGSAGLQVVKELAERKLRIYLTKDPSPTFPVLAADTLICFNGALVGKAENYREARAQLIQFSGKSHQVCSGFALYLPQQGTPRGSVISGSDQSIVTFNELKKYEIETYLEGGDWKGAAGSYRIQGEAKKFISAVTGDFTTVVGLPIQAISAILSSPDSL
jgi:septum formation protein